MKGFKSCHELNSKLRTTEVRGKGWNIELVHYVKTSKHTYLTENYSLWQDCLLITHMGGMVENWKQKKIVHCLSGQP